MGPFLGLRQLRQPGGRRPGTDHWGPAHRSGGRGRSARQNRFWVSQDQRNTAQGRLRFQATRRSWLAAGASFGSGLPVELDRGDTDYDFLLAQYGPRVLDQVDLARGRVRPSYSLDAAAGLNLYTKEKKTITLQLQGSNLTNHLNVINFASLFSGTALAPPRSFGVRLKMVF